MSSTLFSWQNNSTRCWDTTGSDDKSLEPGDEELTPIPQSNRSCLQVNQEQRVFIWKVHFQCSSFQKCFLTLTFGILQFKERAVRKKWLSILFKWCNTQLQCVLNKAWSKREINVPARRMSCDCLKSSQRIVPSWTYTITSCQTIYHSSHPSSHPSSCPAGHIRP